MFLGLREVAGGGAKKELRNWETDLLAIGDKGDLDVKGNNGRSA